MKKIVIILASWGDDDYLCVVESDRQIIPLSGLWHFKMDTHAHKQYIPFNPLDWLVETTTMMSFSYESKWLCDFFSSHMSLLFSLYNCWWDFMEACILKKNIVIMRLLKTLQLDSYKFVVNWLPLTHIGFSNDGKDA